jgi:hypothetical protein
MLGRHKDTARLPADLLLPRIDPGRANYDRFATAYSVIQFAVLAHPMVLHAVLLLITLGHIVDITRIMLMSLGALFVVLGIILNMKGSRYVPTPSGT